MKLYRIFCLFFALLLAGCQTTVVRVLQNGDPDLLLHAKIHPAFSLALKSNSTFIGTSNKGLIVLECPGSFAEAEQTLKEIKSVLEVKTLGQNEIQDIDEILVSYEKGTPLPTGTLLGYDVIKSTIYREGGGFIVIKTFGPISPDLIEQLNGLRGVSFFEPNFVYTIDDW